MKSDLHCIDCRFCDEYQERTFFCELREAVVSGRGYCDAFELYPQILAPC